MTTAAEIPETLLVEFSRYVAAHIGLHFPVERQEDMRRGIQAAAVEFGYKDIRACIKWLMSGSLTQRQAEVLASHLTIGETYFFRDKRSFEILETEILPELIHARRGKEQRLRIWSAACATGEEPYSIAILLSRLLPDYRDWSITILATDINPRFLSKAAGGVYGKWSFRGDTDEIQKNCFHKTGEGCFEIANKYKRMVNFAYLNLVEDIYPSLTNNTNAMDVIFCRNVLMYFSPDQAKKTSANLSRSLIDGGWLVTSPSETSQTLFADVTSVIFPGAILYRKVKPAENPAPSGIPVYYGAPPVPVAGMPIAKSSQASAAYAAPKPAPAQTKPAAVPVKDKNAREMSAAARVCADAGKLTEALEWCDKAIAADKLNPSNYYLSGVILQEQGAIDKAAAALKRALFLDQNFALAYFALGNLSRRQAKRREANRCFDNALQLLRHLGEDDVVPESEGITAGRLSAIIETIREQSL